MCKLSRESTCFKKPNKTDAQVILKVLADKHPESITDLAQLYTYFMPAMPKKVKTNFQWVAQAIAKKDARNYLNFVYVTDSQFIATDGHRLHVTPNDLRLEPGYYFANGDKAYDSDFTKYPDWERIIHPKSEYSVIDSDLASCNIENVTDKIYAYMLDGIGINKSYLDQALNDLDNPVIRLHDKKQQFKIVSGSRTAIIMRVRL